jgi:hypothetical protein
MLQRVLLILFFVIVIVLVVAWIAGGAGKQILSKSGQFVNPFGVLLGGQIATGTSFLYFPPPKMPGIPLPSSLDEAALGGTGSSISAGSSEADTLYGIEDRYSDLDQEYANPASSVSHTCGLRLCDGSVPLSQEIVRSPVAFGVNENAVPRVSGSNVPIESTAITVGLPPWNSIHRRHVGFMRQRPASVGVWTLSMSALRCAPLCGGGSPSSISVPPRSSTSGTRGPPSARGIS